MASFTDDPVARPAPLFSVATDGPRAVREAARRLTTPRYAAAAAVALPLIGLALVRFGADARFAIAAFLIPVLCALTAIDLDERRIPNRIVLPSAALVLAAQIALFPDRTVEWIVAAMAGALVLLLPLLAFPAGVGMGDVKLMLLLGAALGTAVTTALVVGSLAAGAYAAILLLRGGREARHTAFPLGPFLAFGALVALLA